MSDLSIHPRNWPNIGTGEVKNTAKPHNGGGKLAKRQAWLNARRNDHSLTIKNIKNPAAFKTPGSMNEHK